jgi:hypothetical protein
MAQLFRDWMPNQISGTSVAIAAEAVSPEKSGDQDL